VLVIEVDDFDAEPAKRAFAGAAGIFRTAVDAGDPVASKRKPNLVATTRPSRRPAMARPSSSSFWNGP
jgi:hypothetical protein